MQVTRVSNCFLSVRPKYFHEQSVSNTQPKFP